jgi:hypothetical protein
MNYDQFGRAYTTSNELAELLYTNPELDISKFFVTDPAQYNKCVEGVFYADMPLLNTYHPLDISPEEFDQAMQSRWHMPAEYQTLDIAQWLLNLCKTQEELQRVGEELLLYQDRDLFNLLRYLKYMVDTFRKNNIVWGLGRGSSVASYVLYLLGVHKINSIYYDLDISEFLR